MPTQGASRNSRGEKSGLAFVQFTSRQGFAGVQLSLGDRDAGYLAQVRAAKAKLGISLEGIVAPPLMASKLSCKRAGRSETTSPAWPYCRGTNRS